MGVNYTIDCHHCGSHTELRTSTNRRTLLVDREHLADHIDTECAIRCPVCRSRLNGSAQEFHAQVTMRLEA